MSALAQFLIRVYQRIISPILSVFGSTCRHYPSCSSYTSEAIERHGLWAGGWMGFARIMRCHPYGTDGIDRVPEKARGQWYAPWRYGRWRSRTPQTDTPDA